MPPFIGSVGIPDFGLTTGERLTLVLTLAIASAAITQAFVAYRLWRPKVEVFLAIHPDIFEITANSFKAHAHLCIANLSPAGIFVKEICISQKDTAVRQEPTRWIAEVVIPPYQTHKEDIGGRIYSTLARGTHHTDVRAGNVAVEVVFRVNETWKRKALKYNEVSVNHDGDLLFTARK